ncbi:hypothetical protein GOODEAATRI_010827 [Goodea atripinnis]|uniref:Uncharacterized protein n=1 Tax=Goodea atripinnis TaxID=208336 RepID=A0ABV0P3D6_9TELE
MPLKTRPSAKWELFSSGCCRLYLEQVRRQHVVSVSVIEGQSRGEAGHWDAVLDANADRSAPRLLQTEAAPSDDAASSPHQGDGAVVERPAELSGCLPQQHEALSVRNDLGGIESLEKQKQSLFNSRRCYTGV